MVSRAAKLVVALSIGLTAASLFAYFGRKPDLPGKGQPAIVTFEDGRRIETTWDQVFKRVQEKNAWFDPNPGGGWFYRDDAGLVGQVKPPAAQPSMRAGAITQRGAVP